MKRGILAFVGDCPGTLAALADRHGLGSVDCFNGLTLFTGAALKVRRLVDGSIIVGDAFPCGPSEPRSPRDAWGNFIAFTRGTSATVVERAPLTGGPLYWLPEQGGTLMVSHLELIEGASAAAIDWGFVAHALAYRNLRTERTGLAGWQELLPGSRLVIEDRQARTEQTWSPWRHVAEPNPLPLGEIAPELEQRLLASVAAWAEGREDIVVELSGGLDSSIVAAALAGSGAAMSAINFVTADADGDERHYARAVASRCGIAMQEALHDDRTVALTGPSPTANPSSNAAPAIAISSASSCQPRRANFMPTSSSA